MPAIQQDPPELKRKVWTWIRDLVDEWREYEKDERVVPGLGITITDAPGRGRLISADVTSGGFGAVSSDGRYGLKIYQSPYTGSGDAPEDQPLRFKLIIGWIGTLVPENIGNEFVAPDNATTRVWYQVDESAAGIAQSVSIQFGAAVPTDPVGTPDHAPATTCRGLGTITTFNGVITDIINDGRGSRDVAPIVRRVDCETNTLGFFHGPVIQDIASDSFQDLNNEVQAIAAFVGYTP